LLEAGDSMISPKKWIYRGGYITRSYINN